MKYCNNCLQPNTRPNTIFTKEGICPACNYYNSLKEVNWDERFEIIKELVKKFPKCKDNYYDCIIGVSGGKDSTRQALWVRDKLKLNPLLVSLIHPPEQVSNTGVKNISNLINLGFDVQTYSPSPQTWKSLMRDSFFKFSNWARPAELALYSSVPQIAIKYKIQLILWGENPALQVGDLKTHGKNGYDGNNLRYSNTLTSGHEWMLKLKYKKNELTPYIYPSKNEFIKSKIQIIYLGWFLGDWSLLKNAKYSCLSGIEIKDEHPKNTGDLYGLSNLDEDWHNMNHMFKYYKFGFGKTTEYVNEEIRSKRMTRNEAIEIVKKYDGKCNKKLIMSFCKYIDITYKEFRKHLEKSLNKNLFKIKKNGDIEPLFEVGKNL